ncbi:MULTISPECIES: phosphate/phosphite/phosphonate ABC transporter substrate-binding protein [unclassified Arthrobacter]|uniref:phosphate/phosphite/phosphonate ABC transporter substrate-binding protein n=1 Tax=unclassified Arthrobacter TaxID=235627 RepID=UPI001D13BFCC|nr:MULTISPECIES: phosphate/phosphite/phosphonate ABC transporter substrate-binding protein [unclassified Arthrobacter]MCC3291418.1 phosphate/phosphite/phosphonate ABC transporter substrate-binding protein [Arthrobacter sp. zg-Y1110]MCC3301208.1 phosphate/phosphite/phosphonate ABC transporter substrate-binding protein [Arthrobacter sp. zg-Y895]MCC3302455.1 phosphate/phosphite/phosphonate ABC transporter substrate-binding protein [Arthrobacter sp. zg-Y895]UWX83836.1 phosphate/phosphite/phosphonat
MNQNTKAFAALAVASLLLSACGASPNARPAGNNNSDGASSDAPQSLVFAVVPTDDSKELEDSFKPIVAAIEKETGLPTSIEAVSSNAGVIEAQAAERVDVATYGAFSYYLAQNVADVTPVAMDQRTPAAGSGAVQSLGVVAAGSDIKTLEDVQGKDVCFTDPASSTGYLAAAAGLISIGLDPKSDINPIFAGSHDVAVTQMLAGDCDVAFVAGTFITDILPARGVIKDGDVETLWTSPDIPGTPMVIGNWLPEDLRTKISNAVLKYNAVTAAEAGLCPDDQREAQPSWGEEYAGKMACEWGGTGAFAFEPATDEDFATIREICETTQAEVCRNE